MSGPRSVCDLVRKWKPIGWAEEIGQIRSGIGPFLDRRMRERNAWVYREPSATKQSLDATQKAGPATEARAHMSSRSLSAGGRHKNQEAENKNLRWPPRRILRPAGAALSRSR